MQLPDEGSTNKPVMVFIHGGGFQEGSSRTDLYGPEFLMTADIVLVTLNYRLGMLGIHLIQSPYRHLTKNQFLFKDSSVSTTSPWKFQVTQVWRTKWWPWNGCRRTSNTSEGIPKASLYLEKALEAPASNSIHYPQCPEVCFTEP